MKRTGKQIESELCAAGINALWIAGRGMIFMGNYYGTDCAAQGNYDIYSAETAELVLGTKKTDSDFRLDEYLYDRETGKKYRVR